MILCWLCRNSDNTEPLEAVERIVGIPVCRPHRGLIRELLAESAMQALGLAPRMSVLGAACPLGPRIAP